MSYLTKSKEEKQTLELFAKSFIKETNYDLQNIAKHFFIIGFRLNEAVKMDYVTALGYQNIEDLAENEFGFKRSTTYGLMQVYNHVCKLNGFRGTMEMREEYNGYTYSQLLEISKMKFSCYNIKEKIALTDSVRDIQAYVRFWNEYCTKNSVTPDCNLQEWKNRQIKEPTSTPKDKNEQIEMQISSTNIEEPIVDIKPPEQGEPTIQTPTISSVQTSGLKAIDKNCGLLLNMEAKERFITRFKSRFRDYLFFYDTDKLKNPCFSLKLELEEVLVDILDCLEIFSKESSIKKDED